MKNLSLILSALQRPDTLTTIAGSVPPLLQLAIAFGAPVTEAQRDAIFGLCMAIIGYYTTKKNEVL
jgi:hypothetical protein